MRGLAVGADARIEMQLIAVEPPRLRDEPVHEPSGVTAAAISRAGRDVVHVDDPAPREEVRDPEAADRGRVLISRLEARDEPVSLASLRRDAVDERLTRLELAKLGHR